MTAASSSSPIPEVVAQFERRVARWVRDYETPSRDDRVQMENSLLRIVLDFALLRTDTLFAPDGTGDLLANLLARAIGNCLRAGAPETAALATLSSLVFAGASNFASSAVYARMALQTGTERGPVETWLLTVLSSRQLPIAESPPPAMRGYARALDAALLSGQEESFASAWAIWSEESKAAASQFASFDRYILLLWRIVHHRIRELSAARVLRKAGLGDDAYLTALRRTSSPLLFPSQAEAIQRSSLLTDPHQNALVLMPTSTGKSLLGELAIIRCLSTDRNLGVYLAPYRALADQLIGRMKPRLESLGIRCVIRRGGYLSEPSEIAEHQQTVLIATPEAFDATVRSSPSLYKRLACCVFDEFHLIEQSQRGIRYEGIAARLLNASRPEGGPKVVALSPVLTASKNVVDWLRLEGPDIVESAWRPTGRRLAVAGPDRRMLYFTPGERLSSEARAEQPAWVATSPLPHSVDRSPSVVFGDAIDKYQAQMLANVAAAAVDQYSRFREPVLVIAATRARTRLLAAETCKSVGELDDGDPLVELGNLIEERFPYLATLSRCLQRGVCYHNASLPDWVRAQLERHIADRRLRVVVATTTLAEGVDLPFRAVVLSDWQQCRFGRFQPMPSLLFRNIAGRCGRAGVFAEGDTVIVDQPARDEGATGYDDRLKDYLARYVSPPSIGLKSSVEYVLGEDSDPDKEDLRSSLESQFAAYLEVCPDSDDQAEEFAGALLGGAEGSVKAHVKRVAQAFAEDVLAATDFPLLTRNSPLRLTDLGRATLSTGLSPRSTLALARFVSEYAPTAEPRAGRKARREMDLPWDPMLASCLALLDETTGVAELREGTFRRVGNRGFVVGSDRLENLMMGWVAGKPIYELAALCVRGRGGMERAMSDWLQAKGNKVAADAEDLIEDLAIFCESYLSACWAWVLRSAAVVATALGKETTASGLSGLATRMECGVSEIETARVLRAAIPVDRAKADFLIRLYRKRVAAASTTFEEWISSAKDELSGMTFGLNKKFVITVGDIDAIIIGSSVTAS